MKRNIKSVISAIVYSLFLIASCRAEGMQFPNSKLTSQKINLLLAAKQLRVLRRKVVTTTTTEVSEEYELPHEDRSRLSDKLDPELQAFLHEIKAEHDRDMELTVINDTPMLFGLSEQFNQEDPEVSDKIKQFTEHFTIKINGKEIPQNGVEKIRIRAHDKSKITFSLEIKNNKILSLGTFFRNAVASITDKIKTVCFKMLDPLSVQFTYPCRIQEQKLRSDEPISIATLMYKHPTMAAILDGKPEYSKMIEYVRWPELYKVEFHLPELSVLEETT